MAEPPSPKRQRSTATQSSNNLPLANRVILVTGAGGGIGRACCVHLAKLGAKVVAADLDMAAAQDTGSLITNEWCACEVDVSNEKSVEAMLATAVNSFGRLDGAVNAAGIEGGRARLHETSASNFDKVLGVNLRGVFLCMKGEIAQMLKQSPPGGAAAAAAAASSSSSSKVTANIDKLNYCIINLSSSAGLAAMPEFSCYSASKHGIQGLTKSAAREYASDGIRVLSICPSTTDTPMVARFADRWPDWQAKQNASFPVGRIGRAEEVAAMCGFLFGDGCPMATGTSITIDGAHSS